jgi:hypothetical protein
VTDEERILAYEQKVADDTSQIEAYLRTILGEDWQIVRDGNLLRVSDTVRLRIVVHVRSRCFSHPLPGQLFPTWSSYYRGSGWQRRIARGVAEALGWRSP